MLFEDLEAFRKFAAEFAKTLRAPVCVALHGGLGAGKTEFARAVIREIQGLETIVPSPTFTLAQNYGDIYHFDLYRLKNARELEEIGFFDALTKNIVLVEWPEIAAESLPPGTIHIHISIKGDGRELVII